MGVGLSAEGEICYSETAIVRIRVAEVGEMEFLAESRYRTSVVLALFCGMAIAGCGSVGPIAGSAFSGIPAQTEPKVDQADATRSR